MIETPETGTPVTRTAGSDLVVAATVGTAHRSVDLAALTQRLRPEPIDEDPAAALLDAAALSAVARRTVTPTPPDATSPPAQPTPEQLPVVPNVVRQVLSRVSNNEAILIEALTLIRRAGLRLPPELVPGLLDDTRVEVVAATRPVAGEIGHLLMTKNPRWTPPTVPDPTDRTMWDEGTTAQRLEWLRALRSVDPSEARNLLADNYSREGVNSRAEFITVLAQRLSDADQDFLLAAARDRSRVVAAAAIVLLTRLPDSPLRRDMPNTGGPAPHHRPPTAAHHCHRHRRRPRRIRAMADPGRRPVDGTAEPDRSRRVAAGLWRRPPEPDRRRIRGAAPAVSRVPAGGDHLPARRFGAGTGRRNARPG